LIQTGGDRRDLARAFAAQEGLQEARRAVERGSFPRTPREAPHGTRILGTGYGYHLALLAPRRRTSLRPHLQAGVLHLPAVRPPANYMESCASQPPNWS